MATEQTLYDKAASNLRTARLVFDNREDDDAQLNYVGFHLQQALELALKYLLEQSGIEYPKTHDIDQLIRLANESEVNLGLSEYLEDHAEMFSQWEAKSRYVIGYSIEQRKIERALEEIDEYLANIAAREVAALEDDKGQSDSVERP